MLIGQRRFILRPGSIGLTAMLGLLSAVGPLTTDMYLPSMPNIARQFHSSAEQVQLTVSAYLAGFAVGQMCYGPLADRHGRKPVLLAAVLLYCAASLGCALSGSVEALIAGRTLQALGGAGAVVLARAIVRDLYSGARAARELSMISAVMAFAPILAPLAGGVLHTALGWRAVFWVLMGCGISIAGIWLALPETLKQRAHEPVSLPAMLRSYSVVWSSSAYRAYVAIASTAFCGLFAWICGASFVLQDLYGLTPLQFGIAFALGALGYLAGTAAAAVVVMRYGVDRLLGTGSAVMAAGGVMMRGPSRCFLRPRLGWYFPWPSISPEWVWCSRRRWRVQ